MRVSMKNELDSLLEKIKDNGLKYFLRWFLGDDYLGPEYFAAPGAANKHHAFDGGLAYHSIHAAKLGWRIAKHYEKLGFNISLDVVVAGILLHDIGKIKCYGKNENGQWVKTKEDSLFHHIPIGYHCLLNGAALYNAQQKDLQFYQIDNEVVEHLGHIILSHHGRRAWSSPVIPQTLEAYVVHTVEMMDGYMDNLKKGEGLQTIYDGVNY